MRAYVNKRNSLESGVIFSDRALSGLTRQVDPMDMNNLVSRDEDMERPALSEREEADQSDLQHGFSSDAVSDHSYPIQESRDDEGKPTLISQVQAPFERRKLNI
jgi:hypothetical protein